MSQYVTGEMIKALREGKRLTQKQLADAICVSDKTVSKWETGRGLPDISLLEPLAAALNVSVAELLSGKCLANQNRAGNLAKSRFYVCPLCQNALWATGAGAFSCCGILLPPLEAEDADEEHAITLARVENEWFVELAHPMEKTHSIQFLAYVTGDSVQFARLYPEMDAQTRFAMRGHGAVYAYCNRHGLFRARV